MYRYHRMLRLLLLILLDCFIYGITLQQTTTGVRAEHQIFLESQPSSIDIKLFQNQLKHLAPFAIQMMSDRNLTNVTVIFSDLRSDEIGGTWIPEKDLIVSPNPFNLTTGKLTDKSINYKAKPNWHVSRIYDAIYVRWCFKNNPN